MKLVIIRKLIFAIQLAVICFGIQKTYGQNLRAKGYMGLWTTLAFTSEPGIRVSGGLGTFSSQHRPLAIYSPEVKKTYFLYSGTTAPEQSSMQIMISYFDHVTHKVPKPVIVYDKEGVNDPQDNASLSIDDGGYIWVFISGRGRTRPGLLFKSSSPWSIDSFIEVLRGELIFPQPWYIKDKGFFLLHTKVLNGRELYWNTSPDGKSWSDSHKLTEMGGNSQVSGVYGNVIYTVFNYYTEGNTNARTNLYLLKSEDFGETWTTIDGRIVTLPLKNSKNEALIRDFESERRLVNLHDLSFDMDGNPVVLVILSRDYHPGQSGAPRELTLLHWKEGRWILIKVCETDHNFDVGPIYISGNEWEIIAPTSPGAFPDLTGGDIDVWSSSDEGATWRKTGTLTTGSKTNNTYPRRPLNANKEFFAYWTDGDAKKLSKSHIYFTNNLFNKVWILPYSMKNDFAKPVRVR